MLPATGREKGSVTGKAGSILSLFADEWYILIKDDNQRVGFLKVIRLTTQLDDTMILLTETVLRYKFNVVF
jgi:hypothetical protein